MASDLAAIKQHLWSEIERRRDELARLCADGLKLPAENPPGDTRDIADYYATILGHANLPVERFEPRHGRVSLVSSQPGREGGPGSSSTVTSITFHPTTTSSGPSRRTVVRSATARFSAAACRTCEEASRRPCSRSCSSMSTACRCAVRSRS